MSLVRNRLKDPFKVAMVWANSQRASVERRARKRRRGTYERNVTLEWCRLLDKLLIC